MPVSHKFLAYVEQIRELCDFDKNPKGTLDAHWELLASRYYLETTHAYQLAYVATLELARRKGISTDDVLNFVQDMHYRKNAGYAGLSADPFANFRHATTFGVSAYQGCLVRLSDKYQRYNNLRQNPELDMVRESIEDTLLDMISYAIIAQVLKDEESNPC